MQYQVTTLGKLFTSMCLCMCKWSSVDSELSGCGLILTASLLQATLSKLLTCYVLRLTQSPTLHEMGNEQ